MSTYSMGINVDLPVKTRRELYGKIDDVRTTVEKSSQHVKAGLVVLGLGIASVPVGIYLGHRFGKSRR